MQRTEQKINRKVQYIGFCPVTFLSNRQRWWKNGDFQAADSVCMQEMLAVGFRGMFVKHITGGAYAEVKLKKT